MCDIDCFGYEDVIQLKFKLENILTKMEEQNQEKTNSYHKKISELYDEISEKDNALELMQKKLQEAQKKCLALQWTIVQKDQMIDHLTSKLKNIKFNFKQNISPYLESLNDSCENAEHRPQTQKQSSTSFKRINISEYFINLTSATKIQHLKFSEKDTGNSTQETLVAENSCSHQKNNLLSLGQKIKGFSNQRTQENFGKNLWQKRGFKSQIKGQKSQLGRNENNQIEDFIANCKNSDIKIKNFMQLKTNKFHNFKEKNF